MKQTRFTLKDRFWALWTSNVKIVFLIILALVLWYFVSITAAFFWTVFIAFIIFNLDSTIIAQAALICLVMLPILLATGKEGIAEQVAVYAYFLLSMTVGLQIIELKRNPQDDTEENLVMTAGDRSFSEGAREKREERMFTHKPRPVIPLIKVKLKKIVTDIKPRK